MHRDAIAPFITDAMRREHNLKHWPRRWKIELIEAMNPGWEDLYPGLVGFEG